MAYPIKKECRNTGRTWFKNGHQTNQGKKLPLLSQKRKKQISKMMKDNQNGFKKGIIPWNKGKKGLQTAWNKGKKHSMISGEKHHNWKGGITEENHKIRTSLEIQLWRISVFTRDNFICQKYKTKGGKLCAHHINNFSEKKEIRFAIDNGITLSEKAHKEFHKIYGIKNNTREQLEEFLTATVDD